MTVYPSLVLAGLIGIVQSSTAQHLPPTPPAPLATQVDPANIHHVIGGAAAIAGIGDWFFSNGTLCASISDLNHETYLSHRGGSLVDLGFCGRNDDQWHALHDMFNLSRDQILAATAIHAESDAQHARIIVHGETQGIASETRYSLSTERPTELDIETRLTRIRKADRLFLLGTLILHPHRSLTPFALATHRPADSKGFHHPHTNTQDSRAMLAVMFPSDLHVLVGPDHPQIDTPRPEISYGVQSLSAEYIDAGGERTPLRQFAINNDEITLMGGFSRGLWFDTEGKPGLMQFAQTPFMDLEVGASLLLKRRILVAPRADVASITDTLYDGAWINGRTDHVDNRLLVTTVQGHPLTLAKPNQDGAIRFRIPAGIDQVKLVLNTPGHDADRVQIIDDFDQAFSLARGTRPATLKLPDTGILQLVFKGRDGTEDPKLFPDTLDFRVGQRRFDGDTTANRVALIGGRQNLRELSMPPGKYTVYATRGPEYGLSRADIELVAGEQTPLEIDTPQRQVDPEGWLSADLHVHSEFSFDSTLPVQNRIAEFAAQGGHIVVSTEHNRVVDYSPVIEQLGLEQHIVAITGVELSGMSHTLKIPRTVGHSNTFPVKPLPDTFQGGTLPLENLRLGEVIHNYKTQQPNAVFQLNHPRASNTPDADINFLDHLSINKTYDPLLPLHHPQNQSLTERQPGSAYRDIDFDAIELLNGEDMASYARVRADWFSFLHQGLRKTGTANGDSHRSAQLVAIPRNYVRVSPNNTVTHFDQAEFLKAIHRGELVGTTGPLLDVSLNGARMGDTFTGQRGVLLVTVKTADWIPVDTLRVYINGVLAQEITISGEGKYSVPLTFYESGFVTVELSGPATEQYAAIYPGFFPFAFSNPIYIKGSAQ